MAKHLILIRHAQVQANHLGVYVGSSDVALSELGQTQACAFAKPLQTIRPDRCVCSPLKRVRQTADRAIQASDMSYELDEDLREIDFGDWEGKRFEQIAQSHPQAVDRWAALEPDFTFPGGERLADFLSRIRRVAKRLTDDPAQTVLAFTHGGVIRALICHLLGLDSSNYLLFGIAPASITRLDLFDGKGVLTGLNDRHHLEGL